MHRESISKYIVTTYRHSPYIHMYIYIYIYQSMKHIYIYKAYIYTLCKYMCICVYKRVYTHYVNIFYGILMIFWYICVTFVVYCCICTARRSIGVGFPKPWRKAVASLSVKSSIRSSATQLNSSSENYRNFHQLLYFEHLSIFGFLPSIYQVCPSALDSEQHDIKK